MEITLTTPALLFPAVTLLLLAYTNRFVSLANIIRNLHHTHKLTPDSSILSQIKNMRYRVVLIRNMQATGVFSLFLGVVSMVLIYLHDQHAAEVIFAISLVLLALSLALSLWEIIISVDAINMHLRDIEKDLT